MSCSSSFRTSTRWSASSVARRSPQISDRILGGLHEQRTVFRPAPVQAQDDRARLRITPRHLAYLKVSEGCDRLCTFCAIPYMRGKHVTKPIEKVVEEARELAADGVRELILVAQDMTYYGVDLYGRPRLAELLRELDQIEELDWIRILYNYPSYFTEELYEVLGSSRRIIPYLDMPLQHINDRMLKMMNRRHTRAETEAIIDRLRTTHPRSRAPDDVHRGLPGRDGGRVRGAGRVCRREPGSSGSGVFTYSFEPDTPAAKLADHLPDDLKDARRDRVMAVQQPIAEAFNEKLVGRTLDVLIDGPSPEGKNVWVGRTFADAPDVDGRDARSGNGPPARRPGLLRDPRFSGIRPDRPNVGPCPAEPPSCPAPPKRRPRHLADDP